MDWNRNPYPVSMTVGERKAKAVKAAEMLGLSQKLDPVLIEGPLAVTWWGKAWNQNLEGYADYSNRLARGRSYARHGSVLDLRIEAGTVSALVQGSQSRPYAVKIIIVAVEAHTRALLIEACSGKLDSVEALLGGRFPQDLTLLLTAEKTGLFPHPRGIRFSCSCPDSASLCKHVAAALYGVGSRLDRDPSLFFLLRKFALEDLISQAVKMETQKLLRAKDSGESKRMDEGEGELAALFGIDFGIAEETRVPAELGVEAQIPRPAVKRNVRKSPPQGAEKKGTLCRQRSSRRCDREKRFCHPETKGGKGSAFGPGCAFG
jgi:uncharacterized Zn finger protein